MAAPIARSSLADIRMRPTRLILTALSIVVATVFTAGAVMLVQTLKDTVAESGATTPEQVDYAITPSGGGGPGVTPPQAQRIIQVPGVADASINGSTPALVAPQGRAPGNEPWQVTTGAAGGPLSRLDIVKGSAPAGPDEVAIPKDTVQTLGAGLGETITVASRQGKSTEATITGLINPGANGFPFLIYAKPSLAGAIGVDPRVSSVDIIAEPGAAGEAMQQRLRQAAGDLTVRTGSAQRDEEVRQAVQGINTAFAALSIFLMVAVFAAALVVTSTFRIVVAGRRRRTALLRCVGARRGQVLRGLLLESALSGLVAGLIGIVLAGALSWGVVQLVAAQSTLPISELALPWLQLVGCLALAVVVTVVASLAPAISATKVSPLAALGAAETGQAGRVRWIPRLILGVLLAATAILLILARPEDQVLSLGMAAASGLVAFLTIAVLGPLFIPWVARGIGWLAGRAGGVPARIAVGNAIRVPKRIAATTVVLMLGIGLVSAVLVGLSSVRTNLNTSLTAQYPAKVQVTAADSGLPAELAKKLTSLPESGQAMVVRQGSVYLEGTDDRQFTRVNGLDPSSLDQLTKLRLEGGSLADIGQGAIGITRSLAAQAEVSVGDQIRLAPAAESGAGAPGRGSQQAGEPTGYRVAAILPDSSALSPIAMVPQDFSALLGSRPVSGVYLDPAAGASTEQLRRAASAVAVQAPGTSVAVPEDFTSFLNQVISIMTYVAVGLVGMTLLVAVVGVGVTLALSVVERTQEAGLMRALGLTRGKLRATLLWEGAILGATSAVVGLSFGIGYGVLGVRSLNETFQVISIPWSQLLPTAVGLVLLGMLAALIPAARAASASPVEAITTE